MTDPDDLDQEEEPSLDRLSQAFAEAMGRSSAELGSGDQPPAETPAKDVEKTTEEVEDSDTCPVSPKTILEAILFVGHPENEPIQSDAIAKLLRGVDGSEVDELVIELNTDYERDALPLRVASVGSGYCLELAPDMESVREKFYGKLREARLSTLAVDVLAVVAYNQPLGRKEIDEFVGSSCGRVLGQLIRRELLALRATDDQPRRKQYVTTDRFLTLFGMQSLSDLPRSEDPQ
jgi:segregation and condensation protein B